MKKVHLPKIKKVVSNPNPKLLVSIGVAGFVTTAVLTGKATIKANELINEKKDELHVDKLEPKELIKTTYKCFIPPMVSGILSTACILGANSMHAKRTAALATAYQVAQVGINEYKDSVVELIGEEKEKEIVKRTVEKKVPKIEAEKPSSDVELNKNDLVLCYDVFAGRGFYSNKNKIMAAVNEVNSRIYHENSASLNYFYECAGAKPSKLGELMGWNTSFRRINVDIYGDVTKEGVPYLAVEFTHNSLPQYDYDLGW